MIILYTIIAVFIAWIWVDFYRLIDIYEKNNLKYFLVMFLMGCASVGIVLGINKYFLDAFVFELNGNFLNDFIYSVLEIGVVEEFAKIVPFALFYLFLKEQLKEPIDYLAYMSAGALGFSAVENVMYMEAYGPDVINGRAILATVGHMLDTALIAYGIILFKFHDKKYSILIVPLYFLFASISHGFYDFWLIYEGTKNGGWIITVIYFLITISFFSTTLNNALNNSSYFTYKKIIDSDLVAKRMLTYYAIVFLIQFILITIEENFYYAVYDFFKSIYVAGFVVVITCVRLSRFKLIENKWKKLKFELPFTVGYSAPWEARASHQIIKIKGDSYSEVHMNLFYNEYFHLSPLTTRRTYLRKKRLAYIEKKIFLKGDKVFYLTKVYDDDTSGKGQMFLLRPKTNGTTKSKGVDPIVAVLEIDHIDDLVDFKLQLKDFKFVEWGIVKPR